MKNSHNFMLKYEGAALADSTMDVAQLAPALISLSDALTGLNNIANQDNVKVSLQVRALNKGCFIVDLQLAQDFINQIGTLLAGTGVTAYCNAYTIVSSLVEIFMLKKWLDGRKPDTVNVSSDRTVVTLSLESKYFKLSYFAYKGYKNADINAACSKIAAPLATDGIDTLSFSDQKNIATFTKEDLPALNANPAAEILTVNTIKTVVTIETAAFKENAKWKVKIGEQNSVFVSIEDQEFLEKINNGTELFGKGDVLYVDMESTQILSIGKINVQYTIKKVHEHKRSAEQLSLF